MKMGSGKRLLDDGAPPRLDADQDAAVRLEGGVNTHERTDLPVQTGSSARSSPARPNWRTAPAGPAGTEPQRATDVGNGRPSASAMACCDSRNTASRWWKLFDSTITVTSASG